MRLTRQTNYAVRILMYCCANDGSISRIPDIARAYGLSELFLFKVVAPLSKAGIVKTTRGRNGGIALGRAAAEISLLEVVRVSEDSFAMSECFEADGGLDCPLLDGCSLNSALHEALSAFFNVLSQHSIADLVKFRPEMKRLLGIPTDTFAERSVFHPDSPYQH